MHMHVQSLHVSTRLQMKAPNPLRAAPGRVLQLLQALTASTLGQTRSWLRHPVSAWSSCCHGWPQRPQLMPAAGTGRHAALLAQLCAGFLRPAMLQRLHARPAAQRRCASAGPAMHAGRHPPHDPRGQLRRWRQHAHTGARRCAAALACSGPGHCGGTVSTSCTPAAPGLTPQPECPSSSGTAAWVASGCSAPAAAPRFRALDTSSTRRGGHSPRAF